MNKLSEFSDSLNKYVSPKMSFLNNDYVSSILMILLIAYTSLAAPKLPRNVAKALDNPIIQLIFFFLIIYIAKHNAGVAIIASIALLVTLMTINRFTKQEMMSNLGSMAANLDKCNGWDCSNKIIEENLHETVNNVEGDESEFTESGFPINFGVPEKEVVALPQIQNFLHKVEDAVQNVQEHLPAQVQAQVQEQEQEQSSILSRSKSILASSVSGVKNLLKKARIIEGYENSDSSSYSEF